MFSSDPEGVRQKGPLLQKVRLSTSFALLYWFNVLRNLFFRFKEGYSTPVFCDEALHSLSLCMRTIGRVRARLLIPSWSRHA